MRAMSPERAAVQDMATDHGRLCVATAEKFLDRADIVAPSSGCVTDKWLLGAHLADAKAFARYLAPLRKLKWVVYAKNEILWCRR